MTVTGAASRATAPRRRKAPWRDPAGRFSWLKLAVLILVLLPGLLVGAAFANHALGARPITEAIHRIGDWAVRFLILALAVSPVRIVFDWPRVMILRRMLGVTAAAYACIHFLLYCTDQNWQPWKIASEIVLRFYLTIGFIVLLGLLVLAATSFDKVIRQMGRSWKTLHRLVYPLGALALLHYFIQSKANVADAVLYAGAFAWLMLWRALPRRARARLWTLPVLALGAGVAAGAIEALWYAVATKVDVPRVVMANFDISYGPTPAVAVLLFGLVAFGAASARRLFGRKRARVMVAG